MKYFVFLLLSVVVINGCDGNKFTDLSDNSALSSETTQVDVTKDLKSLVAEDKQNATKKITGKKQNIVNISETMGEKNLRKPSSQEERSTTKVTIMVGEDKSSGNQMIDSSYGKELSKVDILFYMNTRDGACLTKFNFLAKEKGFLTHLKNLDWQIAFAYFSDKDKVNLFDLEKQSGRRIKKEFNILSAKSVFSLEEDASILSKPEFLLEKNETIFHETLKAADHSLINYNNHGGEAHRKQESLKTKSEGYTRNVKNHSEDPLSGLDQLLNSNGELFRKDSKTVVVLSDEGNFPYYTKQEWLSFYKKHPHLHILVISSRHGVINLSEAIASDNIPVSWTPLCENENSPEYLAKKISN